MTAISAGTSPLNDSPDLLDVDFEIVVHYNIAKAADASPRNLRMACPESL